MVLNLIVSLLVLRVAVCLDTETCAELRGVVAEQNKTITKQADLMRSMEEHVVFLHDQIDAMETDIADVKKGQLNHIQAFHSEAGRPRKDINMRSRRQAEGYAFTAYLDHEEHLHQGNTLKFNHILYNLGHLYNPITGIATIQESGTYIFTVTIEHWNAGSHNLICYLVVDNVNMVDVILPPAGGSMQSSNTAVLGLQKGQSVWVKTDDGFVWGESSFRGTTFAGFILY